MKSYPSPVADLFVYFSIYPFLIFIIVITGLSCGLGSNLASRLTGLFSESGPTPTRRLVILPTISPTSSSDIQLTNSAKPDMDSYEIEEQTLLPTMSPTLTYVSSLAANTTNSLQHYAPIQASLRKRAISPRFPTPIPTSSLEIANVNNDASTNLFASLPMLTATPTLTAASMVAPSPTYTPTSMSTRPPTPTATATPVPPPTSSPTSTLTPVPDYDFMLAEFYNSPTTNSFLLIYVAIVDPDEIPIGDMKIVGTRLDHNVTYESPLSTWHYEGYNAPGEHIKSGNVKFEPPGGIESTSWMLHLEDAHGNRQSVDIPFDVDEDNKQWYFIKLRRKY